MWTVIDTGISSAEENMEIDARLLASLDEQDSPILRLYDWEGKCGTFGFLTKPEDYLNLARASSLGVSLAKRPTGGGIVFHVWDFAFSVLVPAGSKYFSKNTLENYSFVNNLVLETIKAFAKENLAVTIIPEDAPSLDADCKRFCMAQPTKYDVVWQQRKIAGAAQRQTKAGFLHQGTISLKTPDFHLLEKILLPKSSVLEAMKKHTFSMLSEDASEKEYLEARQTMKQLLRTKFSTL
jgi:lipoate-protein ligase A